MAQYVHQLTEQIKLLGKTNWVKTQPFSAVYFGGGTPTALPVKLFAALLESISSEIPLTPDVELKVETSISELTDEYLSFFRSSMVNRVSMGIQSFDEALRHNHSRIAGFSEIQSLVEKLNSDGIENRCADLMYNLEGQTLQTWESDLKSIAELNFTGSSVYPLLPFPGAPMVRNNTYPKPDPHLEFQYFQVADSFLTNLPLWEFFTPVQYGHSNLGRANYIYQQAIDADILALGPGAGGKINGIQYLNAFSLEDFIAEETKVFSQKSKVFELPSAFHILEEQLRLFKAASMDNIRFDELFGNHSKLVTELIEFDLLEVNEQIVSLTQTGRYWAANLAALFIDNSLKEL